MDAPALGDAQFQGNAVRAWGPMQTTTLTRMTVPLGGQEIELQQLVFGPGAMPLLRTRIREGKRFTVFDVDPQTARDWGDALTRWAREQGA